MFRPTINKMMKMNNNNIINKMFFSTTTKQLQSLVSIVKHNKLPVATITMQSPPVNALTPELVRELKAAVETVQKDSSLRGIVLASASKGCFSAGVNLPTFLLEREQLENFWADFQSIFYQIYTSDLLSIAAINGHSPAGGCILAMACHQRVMLKSPVPNKPFTIGLNEVAVGLPVPKWLCERMSQLTGKQKAETILPLATLLTTEEAESVGLVDKAVSTVEELDSEVNQRLEKLFNEKLSREGQIITNRYLREDFGEKLKVMMDDDMKNLWKHLGNDRFRNTVKAYIASIKKK